MLLVCFSEYDPVRGTSNFGMDIGSVGVHTQLKCYFSQHSVSSINNVLQWLFSLCTYFAQVGLCEKGRGTIWDEAYRNMIS